MYQARNTPSDQPNRVTQDSVNVPTPNMNTPKAHQARWGPLRLSWYRLHRTMAKAIEMSVVRIGRK